MINKKEILEQYRDTVGHNSSEARRLIQKLDYKNDYYLLQCIAQTFLDECCFENVGNKMKKDIDTRKWTMAEKYIIRAFKINPDSSEVLYTMGLIRGMYWEQIEIAIYCFEKIIKLGLKGRETGEYKRGISLTKEIINDSKFELYRLHFYDKPTLSQNYLSMYKKGLEKGITTIYKPLNKFLVNGKRKLLV